MNVLQELRRQNKSEFLDLAKVHLSHLIDVTPEEWSKIVGEEEPKSSSNTHKIFTSSLSNEGSKTGSKFGPPKEKELASNIFGNPLSQESLSQVMILVNFLFEDENHKIEGIFRKSGTQERQKDLLYMLNNGVRVDLKANRFTPVDTSCVLKEYIQKLPEPLLTNNHFELHFELARAIKEEIPDEQVAAKNEKRLKIVQLLLHLMPELNRDFFISLMALLNKVAQSVDITKMDNRSLATIFGQHILCPRSWTPKQVQKNVDIIIDAMEFLLVNYDELFCGPHELVLDAREKLKKYQAQGGSQKIEEDENKTVITFCQRRDTNDTITDQALAELYAQVQAMPDTPHKKKLIKNFNRQNGFGTPMQTASGKPIGGSSSTSKWKSFLPPILRPSKHS